MPAVIIFHLWNMFYYNEVINYFNFVFPDGLVDCIEWSPDGTMLMAGDSTGKLSLLDTDTADVLFSFVRKSLVSLS
jgi:WD40 repeat protein